MLVTKDTPTLALSNILGEKAQRISATHLMEPFLMQMITDSDVWGFIGSQGAIAAGRRNRDSSFFPYTTQDKLFDLCSVAGSFTLIRSATDYLNWDSWTVHGGECPVGEGVQHAVEKSLTGTKITLEAYHEQARLLVRTTWTSSRRYGLIRHFSLQNVGEEVVELELTDGMQNIVPGGVSQKFQEAFSNLADSYKRSERIGDRLALYTLNSLPTDRATPNESLTATLVWSCGFPEARVGLYVPALIRGPVVGEGQGIGEEIRGRRGAFLLEGEVRLLPGETHEHWMVGDPDLDGNQVVERLRRLDEISDKDRHLREVLTEAPTTIWTWTAAQDGLQKTSSDREDQRHFSNTVFNMMRGGTFPLGYLLPIDQLIHHLHECNRKVWERHREVLEKLPDTLPLNEVYRLVEERGDPDLARLTREYLPLVFSRRHGDPSRPWNQFDIRVHRADGGLNFAYQGNWRDIFQNWETSLRAFPWFTMAAINRFLNATTASGYNPYRVTTYGFEWERPEPDAPWSNIGYWGDHQIIYLLKLLEWQNQVDPQELENLLQKNRFVYAQIPYRMKDAEAIRHNPRDTIVYDDALSDLLDAREKTIGQDGKLLQDDEGNRVYGTLLDKLLTPLLEKLTHLVPDAGIWMNTQRPEWNDANNALAGYGASVVTLGYIHRYLNFLIDLLKRVKEEALQVRLDQAFLLEQMVVLFEPVINGESDLLSPEIRARITCSLGELGADHRRRMYEDGPDAKRISQSTGTVISHLDTLRLVVAASLHTNRRDDGLYHSYNLINWEVKNGIRVDRLSLMLEGQVSILSAGLLTASESATLVGNLEKSDLYRSDQDSFMLYPDRQLRSFLDKGVLPDEWIASHPELRSIIEKQGSGLIEADPAGKYRFQPHLKNPDELRKALDSRSLSPSERTLVEEVFEATFHHRSFTGRSGSFFAYEGLGSIYWHMVSKLALAVQENALEALGRGEPESEKTGRDLLRFFRRIKNGLGIHKSPEHYGAFPTDPYSHTPAHTGVQQPGMTGQVKEDILVRLGEMGVTLNRRQLTFDPCLLSETPFLDSPTTFQGVGVTGKPFEIELSPGEFAFTVCQVPVIYRACPESPEQIHLVTQAESQIVAGHRLGVEETRELLARSGRIIRLEVDIPLERLAH